MPLSLLTLLPYCSVKYLIIYSFSPCNLWEILSLWGKTMAYGKPHVGETGNTGPGFLDMPWISNDIGCRISCISPINPIVSPERFRIRFQIYATETIRWDSEGGKLRPGTLNTSRN